MPDVTWWMAIKYGWQAAKHVRTMQRGVDALPQRQREVALTNDLQAVQQDLDEARAAERAAVRNRDTALAEAAALRHELEAVRRELEGLRRELAAAGEAARAAAATREEMRLEGLVYWRYRNGVREAGPFCPVCWGQQRHAIPLQDLGNGYTVCQGCQKFNMRTPGYVAPESQENWRQPRDVTDGGSSSSSWWNTY
ncbi:hypothetical protein [Roseisolibacter sp. H3M3-2]|uniref:hypothetical protein n=1 Tax=Roseisolibacter sp. H3M3-2 TaxID=3031323 RepID=UPI0023DAA21D|nr:hypothetical protein [Roseisolibacter sp. H3M3-2]MDF1502298.1 hypothetical protein [Roseisolibacter sp. H3M3-2]